MKDDLIRRKDAIDKMVYSADIIALRELPSAQDADCISRQDAIDVHCEYCPDKYICCPVANGNSCPEMEVFLSLPAKQPTYTEEEIQKMQTLEQAEIEKAYQLGYEEGKKDAQPEPEVKEISYTDCANAMMKMWIDDVLTYGEYSRIMDKLNAHELSKREIKDETD